MDKELPMPAKVKALFEAYSALNRNDISGFVKDFDPQVERIEPSDFPGSGTYRGLEAVIAHIEKGRGSWAEGGCEPQRFVVSGDKIVLIIQVRVRLKSETNWREGQTADVFTYRDGKIMQFQTFFDIPQALEWAGVSPSIVS